MFADDMRLQVASLLSLVRTVRTKALGIFAALCSLMILQVSTVPVGAEAAGADEGLVGRTLWNTCEM